MHRTVMDIFRETMPCLNFRMVKVDMTKNISAGRTEDPVCLRKSFSQSAGGGGNIWYRIGQEQGDAGNDHDIHGIVQGQNEVYIIRNSMA